MVGRKDEMQVIEECLQSGRPEFLVVYGRRRVGKTYLVKEFFKNSFSFYTTGVSGLNTKRQLHIFQESLAEFGDENKTAPKDWFEAFGRLRKLLSGPGIYREYGSNKRVVFLDELPWMDTVKSDFRSALEYFWNSWGSSQKDLLLIVCGSATSWIINNIVKDTGGLYNRITRQIHLMPFCLGECEQLLRSNGMLLSRRQIIESYMVFGGIPYYLNYLKPQFSLAQNVDMLFFRENSPLKYELDWLFKALFRKSDQYYAVVKTLSRKKSGMTRQELSKSKGVPDGKQLSKILGELDQCGFIRKYHDYTRKERGAYYQLIDPLTLFCLTFLEPQKVDSWIDFVNTPAYNAWCGLSFEMVCLLHTAQIKSTLGISGIRSNEYSWRSKTAEEGAQIDLLIDRRDDVINVCEMKYSEEEYIIDAKYEKELIHKIETFRSETGTDKALYLTMITSGGLRQNQHSGKVINQISGDDLFR